MFCSRGSHVSWDGGPKITKPNHQEIIKRFGFDRKEQSYVILGLGSVISKFIFGDASWFWPIEGSDFWRIGPRCFDLFRLRGNRGSRDGGPKITKPNHQEIVKRLGFDRKEPPYAILELGSVISRFIFGEASWFWLNEESGFWSIGPRCFDLFCSRGSHVSWDGGPKITKPNHQEIMKRFGFDRKEPSYVILKLGSVISKFIFGDASWFWLIEGSDFWRIGPRCFDLFWLRGNRGSRDSGPKITKPNHQEIIKWLGFDRKEPPCAIL